MKASAGSGSRSATNDRAQTAADGGLSVEDGETASSRSLHCKEALLSSSDTDDGDLPYSKLVIDLDASGGGGADCATAETAKLPAACPTSASAAVSEASAAMSAVSSTSSRSETTKSRAQSSAVDGPAKTAPSSHRASSKPPHSAELSNGGTQKGLKMKIRCSQMGGQPPRHEVSHFHTVGSPPPPPQQANPAQPADGGRSTAAASGFGSSKSVGSQEKGRSGSGSHRRDRQLAKDRSAKDRAASSSAADKHQTTAAGEYSAAAGALTGPAAVVVVSRDVLLDSSKTTSADSAVDRDTTSAVLPPAAHDPYEFNASSEDSISCPTKKMKFEQVCSLVNYYASAPIRRKH